MEHILSDNEKRRIEKMCARMEEERADEDEDYL